MNTLLPGRPPKLSDEHKQEIAQLVDTGPDPERDAVVRWRCVDLKQIIRERYGVDLAENSVSHVLKERGLPPSAPERGARARIRTRSTFLKNQTLPERVTATADTRQAD